jgi:hypothetical protein
MVSVDGQRVAYLLGAAGACEGSTALHINKTLHARGDFTSRSRVRAWRWPVAHTPNLFASLGWYSCSRRARGERSLRDASVRPSIHPSIHQSERKRDVTESEKQRSLFDRLSRRHNGGAFR